MKPKSKDGQALDRKLAFGAATDKQHKAEVKRLEQLHKHDMDWFDLEAYQKMVRQWN